MGATTQGRRRVRVHWDVEELEKQWTAHTVIKKHKTPVMTQTPYEYPQNQDCQAEKMWTYKGEEKGEGVLGC